MAPYGEAGKDILYFGQGKPDKGISRRGFGMVAAVGVGGGALLFGAGKGIEYLDWRSSAANPDVWKRIVGDRENPHPEYGHLIWQTSFVVKPGAEFHEYPTRHVTPPEFPFTTPLEGNPVVHKMGDTVMVVKNALLFAQEALGWEHDTAEVRPTDGTSYHIAFDTIRFAVDLPDTPNRMGWLSLDSVRFLDDQNRVTGTLPLDRIIQAPIGGDTPWKGTADILGTPLPVGLVSR
jgi:hypothetical protein